MGLILFSLGLGLFIVVLSPLAIDGWKFSDIRHFTGWPVEEENYGICRLQRNDHNCNLFCLSRRQQRSGAYECETEDRCGCLCSFGPGEQDTSYHEWKSLATVGFTPSEDCTILCQHPCSIYSHFGMLFGAYFEQNGEAECACFNYQSVKEHPVLGEPSPISDQVAYKFENIPITRWKELSRGERNHIKDRVCRKFVCKHQIGLYSVSTCTCYQRVARSYESFPDGIRVMGKTYAYRPLEELRFLRYDPQTFELETLPTEEDE